MMIDVDDGGPAFGQAVALVDNPSKSDGFPPVIAIENLGGMSILDYFAAHAPEAERQRFYLLTDQMTSVAWRWRYANAMIAEGQLQLHKMP